MTAAQVGAARVVVSGVASAVCLVLSLARGQAGELGELWLSVEEPPYETKPYMTVSVEARGVRKQPLSIVASAERTDLEPFVRVEERKSSWSDSNADGVPDLYRGQYAISWWDAPLLPGDAVTIRAAAMSESGEVVAQTRVRVAPNVELLVSDSFPAEPGGVVHVGVVQRHIVNQGETLVLHLDGVEITDSVSTFGPVVVQSAMGDTDPEEIEYQYSWYEIAWNGLTPPVGSRLDVSLAVLSPAKAVVTTASMLAAEPNDVSEEDKEKLWDFVEALQLKRDDAKNVCVGATSDAMRSAADELTDSLSKAIVEYKLDPCPGLDYKVVITVGGSASKASATARADVVVAIGDRGEGTADGQAARAVNSQPGGAAIAIGGSGGSEASSGGDGGDAEAVSQTATSGTSIALGGKGGDPSPDNKKGGAGGKGVAKAGSAAQNLPGGEGDRGEHGTGATASMAKGTADGAAGRSVPNAGG